MNERLSDYLLGELDDGQRAAFEAELARDPALAAEAERLRPVVTRLETLDAAAWDPPEAPALAPLPRQAPDRPPSRWRRAFVLRPLVAGALAALLLALGVGAGLLLGDGGDDDGAVRGQVLALDPVEPLGGAAHGTATISARDGRADVQVRGLKPSADGDFYELWLLNSPDDLVSLGSFRVPASGEVDVSVPLPGNPDDFAALDVSVEPPDGDPAHSSRSVLRAPLRPS
jgi:anti-sigma-K factor RskA